MARGAQVRDRARLRHAVALHDGAAELGAQLARDVLAERCGAREDQPHAREVVLGHERMLHQTEHDGRHQRQDRDPVLLDELEELLEVEARHHDDGAAIGEPEHHDHDHAVDVKERQHRHDDVPLAEAVEVAHALALAEIRHQVVVRQHHALGQARGAARVRQHDDVVARVDGDRGRLVPVLHELREGPGARSIAEHEDVLDAAGLRRRFLRLVEEGRHRHEEPGPRVHELLGQLVGRVERIGGGDDAAQRGRSQHGEAVFRQVGAVDREDVALLEAPLRQARRHASNTVSELAVRERAAGRPIDQGRLVAEPGGVAQDVVGDRHLRNGQLGTLALDDHAGSLVAPAAPPRSSENGPESA